MGPSPLPVTMIGSAWADLPSGVANTTWEPPSLRTFQLIPASEGSKSRTGSGIRTTGSFCLLLIEKYLNYFRALSTYFQARPLEIDLSWLIARTQIDLSLRPLRIDYFSE